VSRDAHSRWIDGVELGAAHSRRWRQPVHQVALPQGLPRGLESWHDRAGAATSREASKDHRHGLGGRSVDRVRCGIVLSGVVVLAHVLARAKQFRAVVNRDHETSVDVAASGIEAAAAPVATTTTTPLVFDDDQIERLEDRADKPAIAIVVAATTCNAKEIGDDRRAKLLQERIADASSEPGRVDTAAAMVVTSSSAPSSAVFSDYVREPHRIVQTLNSSSTRSTTSSSLTSFSAHCNRK
jgi:hypothetical protein